MTTPAPLWRRCDLHLHTAFSGWRSLRALGARDCYVDPAAAFAIARRRGMDFVCFSDHDTIDGALDFLARHPEEEPRVIVAEEVEARFPDGDEWVHVNVFDVDERLHEELVRLRPNCFELVEVLRERGLLFALNHPFQSFRSPSAARRRLAELLPRFPAIEVCNSTSPLSHRQLLARLLAGTAGAPLARIGGSDAHTAPRIACVHTAAPGADKRAFLAAVAQGRCAIGGRPPGWPALVRDVYLVVGAHYARLLRGPGRLDRRRLVGTALSAALLPAALGGVPLVLTLAQVARQEWIGRACGGGQRALRPLPARAEG